MNFRPFPHSNSKVKSNRIIHMASSQHSGSGANSPIRFAVGTSSLGAVLVAASPGGLRAIALGDDPGSLVQELRQRFPKAERIDDDPDFEQLVAKVVRLIEAPAENFGLPLDLLGTPFQRRVWQALREIPAGNTVSYSELARRLGVPKSVRAVAGACAANRLAVAVPCHRAIRSDGTLSGYRWGMERKIELLKREKNKGRL
jgi:AraC family transcriptional regulator of adaptative response/methylated-DNA-[protein]-cysteine methyltransferase